MRAILFCITLMFWQLEAVADERPAKSAQLVQELLELTAARQQYQQMLMGMAQSIQGGFTLGLAKALKDRPLDQASKAKAKTILDRHHQEFIRALQAELQQTLSWDKMVKEIYGPVYTKHFSDAELGDILAFYQSKTGRKFASKGPDLLKDVNKRVNDQYAKQIKASTDTLTDAQIAKITAEIDQLRAGAAKKAP